MSGNVLGERELIRRISEILGGVENDDCAVIDAGERYLVATTDMLHRKTDFPDIMNPWQMGWMAVAVNLSDIAAMGAEPAGVLIAAGLPPEADLYFIDELFSGFGDCAAYYGTRIIGGDTDSHQELTITGTALGFVEKDLVLRRRGARPGDLLCTTGALGGAGGGLWAWQQGVESDFHHAAAGARAAPQGRAGAGQEPGGHGHDGQQRRAGAIALRSRRGEPGGLCSARGGAAGGRWPGGDGGAGEGAGDGYERGRGLRARLHGQAGGAGGCPASLRADGDWRGGGGGDLDGEGRREETGGGKRVRAQDRGDGLNSRQIF